MHLERRERINQIVKGNIKSLEGNLNLIEELNLYKKTKGFSTNFRTNMYIEEN